MTSRLRRAERFQIFPAIGVGRVGDSRNYTYIASEAPLLEFVPPGGYRGPEDEVAAGASPRSERPDVGPIEVIPPPEPSGPGALGPVPSIPKPEESLPALTRKIKRMGCRFRIYEFDTFGRPVREITSDIAEIEWTVHLVNKKAAGDADWGLNDQETRLLNGGLSTEKLTIEAEGTVGGVGAGPVELAGAIMVDEPEETRVKLGDLETDAKGRLVVYGGHGVAASWQVDAPAPDLIRNPGWYDDTSDGTVDATLTIDGNTYTAVRARIVVGPPDYAHPCLAPVTLFDLAFDRSGGTQPDTSFTKHIHPILHRSAFLEWTLFALLGGVYGRTPKHGHGYTGNHDMHPDGAFLDPHIFNTLYAKDPHPDHEAGQVRRKLYFDMLKQPGTPRPHRGQGEPASMPAIEGLTFTAVQHTHFANLANENFDADWPADRDPGDLAGVPFSAIPPEDRPAALNRAAMDFAVGGPFFPGVEVGAIAADPATYVTLSPPDPEIAIRVADTVHAGDLTQSLALPWQTAFNQHNFRSLGEEPADNLWPSARPVLVPAKRSGTSDDMLWTRPLTRTGHSDIFENQKMSTNQHMIDHWAELGFIAPAKFYIEVARTLPEDPDFTM